MGLHVLSLIFYTTAVELHVNDFMNLCIRFKVMFENITSDH